MAIINGSVTNNPSKYAYWIDWWEDEINPANNTSLVHAVAYVQKIGNYSAEGGGCSNTLYIDGTPFTNSGQYIDMNPETNPIAVASGSKYVTHNSDGNKQINISCSGSLPTGGGYGPYGGSASATVTLSTIPRYAAFTGLSFPSKSTNTINVSWSSDVTVDQVNYSLNNGGSWATGQTGDRTSGSFTISGLNPNTSYQVIIAIKRKDSQLWTNSSMNAITTYDIARFSSLSNVNIGDNISVSITNPGSGSISLAIKDVTEITTFLSKTNLGLTNTFTPTSTEINSLYGATPNSNNLTVRYILTTTQNGVSYSTVKEDKYMYVTNANPVFTNFTYQDINAVTLELTGDSQKVINGYSNVKTTVSTANKAIAQKSASMLIYNTTIGSKQTSGAYSSSADVDMIVNGIATGNIVVRATDSRGNYTEVSKNATFINYAVSIIQNFKLERQNGVSTTATITANGTYTNVNFGAYTNTITKVEYRKAVKGTGSFGSWVDITSLFTISGGNFNNVAVANTITGFTFGTEYDIELRVTDRLTNTVAATTLNSGEILIAKNKTKRIVGVGTIPDNTLPEGSFHVADTIKAIVAKITSYIDAAKILAGGYISGSESSGAKLQVNGFVRTGTIYLHDGGTGNPTTENRPLANVSGSLYWDGNKISIGSYPVGAIYQSTSSISPATLFGGTWVALTARVLVGVGSRC